MTDSRPRFCVFSGNALKIIAAISMFIDHMGSIMFPGVEIFRIVGRLAFPIFAFMIAEGCRYTKNRAKYFLLVSLMGLAYTLVYYVYSSVWYFCILITFAFSIAMILALDRFKCALFDKEGSVWVKILTGAIFISIVLVCFWLNGKVKIDYGFVGCITPVLVSLFHAPSKNSPEWYAKVGKEAWSVIGLAVGIALLFVVYGGVRAYAFFAIPLLLLYSGKRGKLKMKYFFYIFYPTHMLALEGLYMLFEMIKG